MKTKPKAEKRTIDYYPEAVVLKALGQVWRQRKMRNTSGMGSLCASCSLFVCRGCDHATRAGV